MQSKPTSGTHAVRTDDTLLDCMASQQTVVESIAHNYLPYHLVSIWLQCVPTAVVDL